MILHLHHVPGRLRVRLAMLKRNSPAAAPLEQRLLAIQGIRSASVNPVTGSVLVYYDYDDFDPAVFWTTLHRLGYIAPEPSFVSAHRSTHAATESPPLAATLVKAFAGALLDHSASLLVKALI